jgi:hypothetical protein
VYDELLSYAFPAKPQPKPEPPTAPVVIPLRPPPKPPVEPSVPDRLAALHAESAALQRSFDASFGSLGERFSARLAQKLGG